MRKKRGFFVVACCCIAVVFVGCCKENCKEETKISYDFTCTENLLDFVTPVMVFNDENGSQKTITLQKNDFHPNPNRKTITNGDTIYYMSVSKSLTWKQVGIRHLMVVQFQSKNSSYPNDTLMSFSHGINASVVANSKNNYYLSQTTTVSDKMVYDVKTYVDHLLATPDSLEVFVDGNGKVDFNEYKH